MIGDLVGIGIAFGGNYPEIPDGSSRRELLTS